jgi:outer membrane protein TolC
MQTLLREVRAVFDPVLDLSLGYNRADSYRREKIGTVRPKSFAGTGGNEFTPFNDPLTNVATQRRINLCRFNPCPENNKPEVRALEFYSTLSVPAGPTTVEEPIVANAGRSTLNNGHPLQQISVSIGLSQELPWGGSLQLTDQTIRQKIYYDSNHYWEDGQYTSNLTGTFNAPIPFGKGFGADNPHNSAIRNAEISRERADWSLKDLLNRTLRDIDLAYFEVVRQLEALNTTVENQALMLKLKERQDRILKQEPGLVTRYQEAQIGSEVTKAGIQVEQALQNYISASVALAQLIGDPDARTGSALYLPYAYAREVDTPLAIGLESALATARINRPDFFIVKLDRDSATVGERLAENQARPDIQVGVSLRSGENGSVYGYSDPLHSTERLIRPDTINQNYSLTYTRPWGNRAAEAAVEIARLSVEDREIVIRDTDARVKREITTDLAQVQSARARLSSASIEAKALAAAYDSLERQLGAGLIGEDQVITAARNLLSARLAQVGAKIDNREAETTLLYAQGTIANALPAQTAESPLDSRRLGLLADAGYLHYFGPTKK